MPRPSDSESGAPEQPKALARDTWGDKGIRFGCGGALGLLLVAAIGIYAEGSIEGVLGFGGLVIALFGTLGVTQGDRFLRGVLGIMKWL